ncbi:serine/threonine-protein kinase max-2 isoform X2 [Patella vulgata]|nr:serine/threonine-protein kinase max-2 isoform X2 [Patella vulgata]
MTFFYKVQLLFKLFHPNIVKICQIYMDSKSLKLSPCYCGLSIYERICVRKETFEDQFLINLIRNLFSVLEFIHRKGFIHRNIQPRNICLDGNGKLCLVGFDFCTNLQDSNTNKLEIDYRSTDCSPEYFSPELCQQIVNADDKKFGCKPRYKDVQITNKSDTYAAGLMICLFLKKKKLLEPEYLTTDETYDSNRQFIQGIAKDPGFMKKCRPDDMPQDWKKVVDKCLEGDASERCDVSDVIVLLREMEKIRAMGNKPVAIEGTQPDHNLQNLSNTRQITDHSKQQLNPQDGAEHFTVDQQTVPSSIAQTSHQIICKGLNDKIKNQRADARIPAESLHGEMTNHTLDRPPPESNNIPQATDNVAGSGLEPVYGSDDDIRISLIPTTIYDDD